MPTASVIIPSRNRAEILIEVLRTLARQSCSPDDYEVIVVDDGSTDDTFERLRANHYPFRLGYERVEAGEGFCPARPRNRGLSRASGEVAILLDTDVLCSPQLISQHIAAHRRGDPPRAVVGYTYGFPAHPDDRTPDVMKPPAPDELLERLPQLLARDPQLWGDSREPIYAASGDLRDHSMPWQVFWTNNVSVPRRLALEVGGFDEQFVGWGIEDVEFAYRLFRDGTCFTVCRDAWGVHYPHPSGDRYRRSTEMEVNCRRLIRKHPDPKLEFSVWAWERATPIWNALEGLRLSPPRFDRSRLHAASAFLRRLRVDTFAPGPILWCGDAPELLTSVVDPAAYCSALDPASDVAPARWPLLGVRLPWEDATFAGVIVTDYWRCVPAMVLARMVEELTRVAPSIALLRTDATVDTTGLIGYCTREDCRAALDALPDSYAWEERVGPGLSAFLVYPLPRGFNLAPRGSSASLGQAPGMRALLDDRSEKER